jgi:hypothetical protein
MRPSPSTLGQGRSRLLRSMATALRFTESLAGMAGPLSANIRRWFYAKHRTKANENHAWMHVHP